MILDSNAISELTGDQPSRGLLQKLSSSPVHQIPVIVLGEIRFGAQFSHDRSQLETRLNQLIDVNLILPIDEASSQFSADIRADLRRRGTPIPHNDLWIAALARQHNLAIVTQDVHFRSVQGLQIVSW